MDSMPDIDSSAGIIVERPALQGRITFDRVEFTYQMRPDHPVIKGLSLDIPAGIYI
jgi:ABC-type bacteriocin/lantibiotic exporter with double-glycine peptidase domain